MISKENTLGFLFHLDIIKEKNQIPLLCAIAELTYWIISILLKKKSKKAFCCMRIKCHIHSI